MLIALASARTLRISPIIVAVSPPSFWVELVKLLDPVFDEGALDDLNLHLLDDITDFSSHDLGGFLEEHDEVWSNMCVFTHGLV